MFLEIMCCGEFWFLFGCRVGCWVDFFFWFGCWVEKKSQKNIVRNQIADTKKNVAYLTILPLYIEKLGCMYYVVVAIFFLPLSRKVSNKFQYFV